jgi:hypothetical protein
VVSFRKNRGLTLRLSTENQKAFLIKLMGNDVVIAGVAATIAIGEVAKLALGKIWDITHAFYVHVENSAPTINFTSSSYMPLL